jgi:hypothetical protein
MRTNGEAGHAFHMTYNQHVRIANNYFHQHQRDYMFYYQYLSPGTDLHYENNYFLSDTTPTDFVGIFPSNTTVSAAGNTYVGDGESSLGGVDRGRNTFFSSRSQAGIGAYPAIPESWPIDMTKL